ncbi:hypothetical protein LP7551_02045 [Roseibium album]|nr:hypothetical protein LP7551_02045 [Roseibium album]
MQILDDAKRHIEKSIFFGGLVPVGTKLLEVFGERGTLGAILISTFCILTGVVLLTLHLGSFVVRSVRSEKKVWWFAGPTIAFFEFFILVMAFEFLSS